MTNPELKTPHDTNGTPLHVGDLVAVLGFIKGEGYHCDLELDRRPWGLKGIGAIEKTDTHSIKVWGGWWHETSVIKVESRDQAVPVPCSGCGQEGKLLRYQFWQDKALLHLCDDCAQRLLGMPDVT